MAPWTLPKKPESRGVVGVAGGNEQKLVLKGKESLLLPEIDSLLASGAEHESFAGVCGDDDAKRLPAAVTCLASFSDLVD